MKRLPEIECPKCEGKGHVELPRVLAETLEVIKQASLAFDSTSIQGICIMLPKVKRPAIRERVKALAKLGLLRSEKVGAVTFYKPRLRKPTIAKH